MSDAPLMNALDDCLRAIEAGASPETVLARYPDLEPELRALLAAVEGARPAEPIRVPRQSEEASRARLLAQAQALRRAGRPLGWLGRLQWAARLALVGLAVLTGGALGVGGLVSASAASLPGDNLYGVKRAAEQIQLALAADAAARAALADDFELRRLVEARTVVEQRRPVTVEFSGLITQQRDADWVVAGLPVRVPFAAPPGASVGADVSVRGEVQDTGGVLASHVIVNAFVAPSPTPAPTRTLASATTPPPTEAATETTAAPTITATAARPTTTATVTRPAATRTPRPAVTVAPTQAATNAAVPTAAPENSPAPAATATPAAGSGGSPAPSVTTTPTLAPSNTPEPTQTPAPSQTVTETPEPPQVEFNGIVDAIEGAVWVVSGDRVQITSETRFEDNPSLGDTVEVKAWQYPDGTLVARRITKK